MSGQINKVAVAGGTGNLGPAIVQQLLDAGFTVTVLSRSSSTSSASLPSAATIVPVDYTSPTSLTSALSGHDALVSNLGSTALSLQPTLIDAAISAGISRFIPSEFGCDTTNPQTASLPVFAAKIATQKYLAKAAAEGKISYTLIATGAFLDWGTRVGFIANVQGGTTTLFDGGDVLVSATTLSDIGKAVAGVLRHPEETRDRIVYVHSAAVTQNQLLAAARKAKPGLETETLVVDTAEKEREGRKVLASGEGDVGGAMRGFVTRGLFGKGFGGHFERTENELLGVPRMSQGDVESMVAGIV